MADQRAGDSDKVFSTQFRLLAGLLKRDYGVERNFNINIYLYYIKYQINVFIIELIIELIIL